MEMKKSLWSNDGDTFSLSMGIQKVDKARRLVFGWATVDNADLQGDVVTFEASQKAFAKFKGNLREMHQPIAAGRMVEYRPQQYIDEEGNAYNGLFVSAYVSEGAESTWKKVLDGTLAAFSINGDIDNSYTQYDPKSGKTLRYVTDYTMKELSLVDAGGNQYSNVVSFAKDVDGKVTVEGDLANVEVQNVFLCKKDHIVELSQSESLSCQNDHPMENIGWVEGKAPNTMEKVNALVKESFSVDNDDKGGVDEMADEAVTETNEETAAVEATESAPAEETAAVVTEVPAAEETSDAEKPAEAYAESEEAKADEEEEKPEGDSPVEALEKAMTAAIEEFKKSGERLDEHAAQIMKDIDGKFDEFRKEFDEKFAQVDARQEELTKSLASVSEGLNSMTKDVDGLQEHTALKKSGDLGGDSEGTLVKSEKPGVWRGSIL